MTDALISMAQELDLYVVAEGIENAEQHRFLKDRFCEWYQGFYWYKPIPWEAFVRETSSPIHARDARCVGQSADARQTAARVIRAGVGFRA